MTYLYIFVLWLLLFWYHLYASRNYWERSWFNWRKSGITSKKKIYKILGLAAAVDLFMNFTLENSVIKELIEILKWDHELVELSSRIGWWILILLFLVLIYASNIDSKEIDWDLRKAKRDALQEYHRQERLKDFR